MQHRKYIVIGIVVLIAFAIIGRTTTTKIAEAKHQEFRNAIEMQTQKKMIEEKLIDDLNHNLTSWMYNKSDKMPRTMANEMITYIYQNCSHPKIIIGIIKEESDFDPFAYRADTKVYGLGQIKYDVWKDELKQFDIHEARDLYDWKKNIVAMNYIFNKYYDQQKSLEKALSRYVGEINNDMQRYRSNILTHVGALSMVESEMVKFMIRNKQLYHITRDQMDFKENNS
jgi:hypothetical protein